MTATWMPREQWDQLLQGEACPLCQEMEVRMEPDYADRYGHTITTLDTSVFRLCTDQFSPGYSVVIYKQHVVEPHDLPAAEQAAYLADVMDAGKAVQRALGADKMNYLLLGNGQPHTHCHLVPRYYGDPAGGRPFLPEQPVPASTGELLDRVERIRAAI
ncbi:HIT family protein [Actinopolymorpha sp. B9G3]|uniref:HIT family protein n=1 Tax=Actinopolymorpha sp. B9G3 TaxID=3158970 RepID=UPI0032D8FD61